MASSSCRLTPIPTGSAALPVPALGLAPGSVWGPNNSLAEPNSTSLLLPPGPLWSARFCQSYLLLLSLLLLSIGRDALKSLGDDVPPRQGKPVLWLSIVLGSHCSPARSSSPVCEPSFTSVTRW